MKTLVQRIRDCRVCEKNLPLGPRPVVQLHPDARIMIAGQAPGSKVHKTGVPFDDPSGDRLREWMGIDKATFYDERRIAILPMGFCYPGTSKSGDLPPLKICATTWRREALEYLSGIRLTLLIGQYAQSWHLDEPKKNLTETVRTWRDYGDDVIPLPHPSPRNNIWLSKNAWFEKQLVPELRRRVGELL